MKRTRREVLKTAAVALAVPQTPAAAGEVEVRVTRVSRHTIRLTILRPGARVALDGSLLQADFGPPSKPEDLGVTVEYPNIRVRDAQSFHIDEASRTLTFDQGSAPLLAFGQGGPQFDRRGSTDRMRSGQGGYQLRTHGGRVPIHWLISTGGWAMFLHNVEGTYDLTSARCKFQTIRESAPLLPLDIFLVLSRDPATILSEYALLTGQPELPPLWSFGYQQSHRTLASRESVLAELKTFREKKLPCDMMIYLGTGFCPSGWNTNNGKFDFNTNVFPDPKAMFDEMHAQHFKVALHIALLGQSWFDDSVKTACDPSRAADSQPSCYWEKHRPLVKLGVDGWWPDEGDQLQGFSRLNRIRMYWEAQQRDRPNERVFALHRNGYAGMQRYAPFLWSGDVYSTWETLKTHVPIAVNTGLSGIPYWGTDIGGFVPTPEFTAELYVRWFQFGAFCPLFRSHGRNWTLRLPWGWNTGDSGPNEMSNYNGAGLPDASQLHDARVEPICRKYLELRYRLMPYLYSAARESTVTGLPIVRAMWLHHSDDPSAVARGDQYLWGRDILVAPVVEKGAASRSVYLPKSPAWYDYWTGEKHAGGQEISRRVDLETTPLYVRAGTILPHDPVRQYTGEPLTDPTELRVYPGANGAYLLYEDDGHTFNYRNGEWMGIQMNYNDAARALSLRLANGSKLLGQRKFIVKREGVAKPVTFDGRPVTVRI